MGKIKSEYKMNTCIFVGATIELLLFHNIAITHICKAHAIIHSNCIIIIDIVIEIVLCAYYIENMWKEH